MQMQNVLVAIGGSGTKVAEALVRLLAIGFPTSRARIEETDVYTSVGDKLLIWRVDTDAGNGASHALQQCVENYNEMQNHLSAEGRPRWGMDIEPQICHLNPLHLPNVDVKIVKNLRGLLDSGAFGKESSKSLLDAFFEPKELEVKIDKGFYQKPFIGAAVMAMFASSLAVPHSPGAQQVQLNALSTGAPVRFFLCGSLHGGTGASGVPVLGRFLREQKAQNENRAWRIGACLLAPYVQPSDPPIDIPAAPFEITDSLVESLAVTYGARPAFAGMTGNEKQELVRQILQGFFANPKEMEARFQQGLQYFSDYAADYFDDIYVVGKYQPDILPSEKWSNGGSNQNNPLNSAEVIAALQALEFFSDNGNGQPGIIKLSRLSRTFNQQKFYLRDLPTYKIGTKTIDPERVFLASALLRHLLVQVIPWEYKIDSWPKSLQYLKRFYGNNPMRKRNDQEAYLEAARLYSEFLSSVVSPDTTRGWEGTDASQLYEFLSDEEDVYKKLRNKLKTEMIGMEARQPVELGDSAIKISIPQFGQLWPYNGQIPDGEAFTRGDYLRFLWSHLFTRGQK
jgi:hypothetical protein